MFLAGCNCCYTQLIKTNAPVTNQLTNNGNLVTVLNMDGKPFKIYDAEVVGHVFLTDEWQVGNIYFTDGKMAMQVKVKINIYNNYLHFLNAQAIEMYKEANEIALVQIVNPFNNDSIAKAYKCLETAKNGKKITAFFEQISPGKIELLKLVEKKIVVSKNEFNKQETKELVQYEEYFVYTNAVVKEVKKKKAFFQELLFDKWDAIDKYINENNLDFRTIGNIKKIIEFYNNL